MNAFPIVKTDDQLSVDDLKRHPHRIWDMLPEQLSSLTRSDAEYHFQKHREWIELNQVDAPRNLAIHRQVIDLVGQGLRPGDVLLELGGGVAYDAQKILARAYPLGCYLFSEISVPLITSVSSEITIHNGTPLIFCALDAGDLRITSEQVDIVLMIAALHHLPDLAKALREIERVSRPGARIIFGIEPNRLWSRWLAHLRKFFRPIFPQKTHSAADEESEGFTMADFEDIARQTGWHLISIRPVWFMCGFLHYGLEFLYRALRLKRRIRLPEAVEYILVALDGWLLRIAFLQSLAWHYTVCYEKNSKGP